MLRWEEIQKKIKDHKPFHCKFPKCKARVVRPGDFCTYHDLQIKLYKKRRFGG
jgi:hypothetical protein